MDLGLTTEQALIRDTVRAFSKQHVGPHAAQWDREERFPVETLRALGPLGLLGALVPQELGGAGLDPVSYLLALEELAYGDAGFSVGVAVHTSVATVPIVEHGTPEQKQRFLPPLISGEKIGAFAITEPQAGSDLAHIRTRATRQGKDWVINGEKVFITNGSFAGQFILAARTGGEGHDGISLFVVDGNTTGLVRGGHEEKMGLRSSDTARLSFNDMVVSGDRLLGPEGGGFKVLMGTLNASRLGIAAQALGMGRRALDESIAYAQQRKQFKVPLSKHQAIQFMVADMATKLEAARLMVWKAAGQLARGKLRPEDAAMAKLLASEACQWVAEKAVQIHGGNGYIKDYVVERIMRDAPVTRIYEGTSEVQKIIIGRALSRP